MAKKKGNAEEFSWTKPNPKTFIDNKKRSRENKKTSKTLSSLSHFYFFLKGGFLKKMMINYTHLNKF